MHDTRKPIAVIGERELVIGFRLIGLRDTFVGLGTVGAKQLVGLVEGGQYSIILASESLRSALPVSVRASLEKTLDPLVVFLPTPGAEEEGESVSALAKRVLGISIENLSATQLR